MSQDIDYCEQALQSLTETINRKISEGAQRTEESVSSVCIDRVPKDIRKLNESAYTPRLFSIGPLHSKDKHLKSRMQDIKMSYVNSLLCRMTDGSEVCKFAILKQCLEEMKQLLEDAKKCYTEEVGNLNEEMMVVDGCFILELLYRYSHYRLLHPPKNSDPVFGCIRMTINVLLDLLLLENQLPFFVLEKLFHITVYKIPGHPPNYLLFDYVDSYFRDMMMSLLRKSTTSNATNRLPSECALLLFGKINSKNEGEGEGEGEGVAARKKNEKGYYHILHILHDICLPLNPQEGKDYSKFLELMPSASDLEYAGVKFVAGTGQDLFKVKFTAAQSSLGRCFHRARFEIQTLCLDDFTEPFLRNLIAFEQCFPNVSNYFTSYALLMDMLVNSAKDVEVLQKTGIIQKYLGAYQDASDLFNNLFTHAALNKFFFAETCYQATKYSKHCWPKTMAYVRRKYFATPWTFIAFCVAFIAFGMSTTQFVRDFFK